MKRKTLKKALSAFLSLLMCMMTLLSISTPVFAATTVDAYMVDFPRDGDSNYSATAWGHSATSLMGGWRFLNSKYTTVHSIGTYNGQVSYCIEPGIGQNAGDTLSHKDETFWENYPSHLNPTISPDTIKVLLGRIMQYTNTINRHGSNKRRSLPPSLCMLECLRRNPRGALNIPSAFFMDMTIPFRCAPRHQNG